MKIEKIDSKTTRFIVGGSEKIDSKTTRFIVGGSEKKEVKTEKKETLFNKKNKNEGINNG